MLWHVFREPKVFLLIESSWWHQSLAHRGYCTPHVAGLKRCWYTFSPISLLTSWTLKSIWFQFIITNVKMYLPHGIQLILADVSMTCGMIERRITFCQNRELSLVAWSYWCMFPGKGLYFWLPTKMKVPRFVLWHNSGNWIFNLCQFVPECVRPDLCQFEKKRCYVENT